MHSWSNQIKAGLVYKTLWLDNKLCSTPNSVRCITCHNCHFLTIVSRHCFSSGLQMLIHGSTEAYRMCCDSPSCFYSNKAQSQLQVFMVWNPFHFKLGVNSGFVGGVVRTKLQRLSQMSLREKKTWILLKESSSSWKVNLRKFLRIFVHQLCVFGLPVFTVCASWKV